MFGLIPYVVLSCVLSFHTRMNVSKIMSTAKATASDISKLMSRAFLKNPLSLLLCDCATVVRLSSVTSW